MSFKNYLGYSDELTGDSKNKKRIVAGKMNKAKEIEFGGEGRYRTNKSIDRHNYKAKKKEEHIKYKRVNY
jgi:hypothetical protein